MGVDVIRSTEGDCGRCSSIVESGLLDGYDLSEKVGCTMRHCTIEKAHSS